MEEQNFIKEQKILLSDDIEYLSQYKILDVKMKSVIKEIDYIKYDLEKNNQKTLAITLRKKIIYAEEILNTMIDLSIYMTSRGIKLET